VLLAAIRDGIALITWTQDSFADADDYKEGCYAALRGGQQVMLVDADAPGLLVKPDVAYRQLQVEIVPPPVVPPTGPTPPDEPDGGTTIDPPPPPPPPPPATGPKRFHGTVVLNTTRVGRDAGQIAEEVIAHLSGLVGAKVTITLEIEAEIPDGAPDHVVRTVTENSRVLKFESKGFEME
jgi:hypothetical protein